MDFSILASIFWFPHLRRLLCPSVADQPPAHPSAPLQPRTGDSEAQRFRGYMGLYRDIFIGIMEKKMEATIVSIVYRFVGL